LFGYEFQWKLIGFYGNLDRALRLESWQLLSLLSSLAPSDWLCICDFNEITNLSKKVEGAMRSESQMANFRSALDDCRPGDLGFKGSKYTWSNKRGSVEFVKERLDRALATRGWCDKFPDVEVEVLAT
jgi:hypothetical protein